ncbi:hypothetical protein [Micromonospora sp. 067-2]
MGLFDPSGAAGLGLGILVQAATIVVCMGASWAILRHRDPAA